MLGVIASPTVDYPGRTTTLAPNSLDGLRHLINTPGAIDQKDLPLGKQA